MFNKIRLTVLLSCFVVIGFCTFAFLQKNSGQLRVAFLDVGQGDSVFIETPNGRQILIDGGPDRVILSRISELMPFWDRSLDMVVLTHSDADHLTGLIDVIDRYQVNMIVMGSVAKTTPLYEQWREKMKEEHFPVYQPHYGQTLKLDEDITWQWLTPFADMPAKENNDNSLVARLSYQDVDFLFTGDISSNLEKELIENFCLKNQSCPELESEVLKVAHHGSKNSTDGQWLEKVKPQYAVIQVSSDNSFGHPHPAVLKRLQLIGAAIFRTDQDGTVVFETNGRGIISKKNNK